MIALKKNKDTFFSHSRCFFFCLYNTYVALLTPFIFSYQVHAPSALSVPTGKEDRPKSMQREAARINSQLQKNKEDESQNALWEEFRIVQEDLRHKELLLKQSHALEAIRNGPATSTAMVHSANDPQTRALSTRALRLIQETNENAPSFEAYGAEAEMLVLKIVLEHCETIKTQINFDHQQALWTNTSEALDRLQEYQKFAFDWKMKRNGAIVEQCQFLHNSDEPCVLESFNKGQSFVYYPEMIVLKASEDVFVCKKHGRWHVCTPEYCDLCIDLPKQEGRVCLLTNRLYQPNLASGYKYMEGIGDEAKKRNTFIRIKNKKKGAISTAPLATGVYVDPKLAYQDDEDSEEEYQNTRVDLTDGFEVGDSHIRAARGPANLKDYLKNSVFLSSGPMSASIDVKAAKLAEFKHVDDSDEDLQALAVRLTKELEGIDETQAPSYSSGGANASELMIKKRRKPVSAKNKKSASSYNIEQRKRSKKNEEATMLLNAGTSSALDFMGHFVKLPSYAKRVDITLPGDYSSGKSAQKHTQDSLTLETKDLAIEDLTKSRTLKTLHKEHEAFLASYQQQQQQQVAPAAESSVDKEEYRKHWELRRTQLTLKLRSLADGSTNFQRERSEDSENSTLSLPGKRETSFDNLTKNMLKRNMVATCRGVCRKLLFENHPERKQNVSEQEQILRIDYLTECILKIWFLLHATPKTQEQVIPFKKVAIGIITLLKKGFETKVKVRVHDGTTLSTNGASLLDQKTAVCEADPSTESSNSLVPFQASDHVVMNNIERTRSTGNMTTTKNSTVVALPIPQASSGVLVLGGVHQGKSFAQSKVNYGALVSWDSSTEPSRKISWHVRHALPSSKGAINNESNRQRTASSAVLLLQSHQSSKEEKNDLSSEGRRQQQQQQQQQQNEWTMVTLLFIPPHPKLLECVQQDDLTDLNIPGCERASLVECVKLVEQCYWSLLAEPQHISAFDPFILSNLVSTKDI